MEGNEYCTSTDSVFAVYVNGEQLQSVTTYVPNEGDQILLYYGVPDETVIADYLNEVTTDACIYSGTCPERGLPPPESCGLTCEL